MPTTTAEDSGEEETVDYVSSSETQEFISEAFQNNEEVTVVPAGAARKVLTEKRMELLETLDKEDFESIRGLSRELDRDPSVVKRDLDTLWEYGVIDYIEEDGRKKPARSGKIVIEPF